MFFPSECVIAIEAVKKEYALYLARKNAFIELENIASENSKKLIETTEKTKAEKIKCQKN